MSRRLAGGNQENKSTPSAFRQLPTELRLFSCQTSKVKGAATRWSSHDPGVTAPKNPTTSLLVRFRYFGSGNAAPAVSDQLFGATEIALFRLIIRLFERRDCTSYRGKAAQPHIQRGRCAGDGRCAMYRSSNHFRYLQKIRLALRRSSWDYRHSLKTVVKTFFEELIEAPKNVGTPERVKFRSIRCAQVR